VTEATNAQYLVLEVVQSKTQSLAERLEALGASFEVARTKADALERMTGSRRFAGVILDHAFPDGALDDLASMRERDIFTAVLVVALSGDTSVWTTAQRHGAYVLPAPLDEASLGAFLHWTRRRREAAHAWLTDEVDAFGARHGLSAREREIVRLAASGIARHELTSALAVEESTVKTTVRRLLRKARRSTLSEVVAEVHRAIFLSADSAAGDRSGTNSVK